MILIMTFAHFFLLFHLRISKQTIITCSPTMGNINMEWENAMCDYDSHSRYMNCAVTNTQL